MAHGAHPLPEGFPPALVGDRAVRPRRGVGRIDHDECDVTPRRVLDEGEPTGYGATIVLWNPGAPIVGPGNPFTNMATLAQFVSLPNVTAIAAKKMDYQGDARSS